MNEAFIAVLLMSATGTLLLLCLALLRPWTAKMLSATWHYSMYILVALFLIVPAGNFGGNLFSNIWRAVGKGLPNVPVIIKGVITAQKTDILSPKTGQVLPRTDPAGLTPAFMPKTAFSSLPLLWLVGVLVFIILHGFQFIRFRRKIMRTSLKIDDGETLLALKNSMAEMGIKGKVRLLSNNIVKTPMLAGLFETFLILPEVEMSQRELKLILKHELTHFKRCDLWVKVLTLLANAIHWFNPGAYWLTKNIDIFCELSCDEQVVSDMDMAERQFYGETILNILSRVLNQHSGIYTTLAEPKKGIERRLTHIMNVKSASKRIIVISFAIAIALCLTGFAMASFMNVARGDKDLSDNLGKYSANGTYEPEPDHAIRDLDVVHESNAPNDRGTGGKYLWPLTGYSVISCEYGARMHPVEKVMKFHNGIDIPAPEGTPVLAAQRGKVAEMGDNETDGNYIILNHGGGIETFYSILFGFSDSLAAGDTVEQGAVIGYVGQTGEATGNHLHFGLIVDGGHIDPMDAFTQGIELKSEK